MNQKDKTSYEGHVDSEDSSYNMDEINLRKRKLIKKLMEKHALSEDDATKLLQKLIEKSNSNTNNPKQNSVLNSDNSDVDINLDMTQFTTQNKQDSYYYYSDSNEFEKVNNQNNSNDVDEFLSGIIPNYDRKVSIEVNNVDLTFETELDRIDTIKERIIRILKNEKRKKKKVHALKNISFKIYQGEKIGIIGYNGAGKSTLLNVISGIYKPDSGSVNTYGNISPLLSLGAGFDSNYSGSKNIFLNGAILGYDKKFIESKYDEIVEFSELKEFIDIPIKNYSSGMLAKLGFSIATIVEPDILIIDEILGVGDLNFRKKSSDKIKSLMDGETTVILVSHALSQIRQLCDKAIWIDHGAIKMMGEANQVCDKYLKDAEKASREQLKNIELN